MTPSEGDVLRGALARRLDAELERWAESGRRAPLWWRDDDAVRDGPALRQLRATAQAAGVPVTLASVPGLLEPSLADATADWTGAEIVQHGYRHTNHSGAGEKKCEFGADRETGEALAEIGHGMRTLQGVFGARFVPVFVPPWNRIAPAVVAGLATLGHRGLSTFKRRAQAAPAPGLRQVNCHVDVIDWRGTRGFAGALECMDALLTHLARERLRGSLATAPPGAADAPPGESLEPAGVLTHHGVHDAATWTFLAALLGRLGADPRVQMLSASAVFRP